MKNRLHMLFAAAFICTLANAEDYSEKIKQTTEECNKILDDMFFINKEWSWDRSIEGQIRASEKMEFGPVETTGWWIGHRKNRILNRISNLKKDIRENGSEKKLNDEDGCGKRIKHTVKRQLRRVDYLRRKDEIDTEIDAAADEVLKSVEMRVEENTKKLIPLIPYNVSDEVIGMNYNQLLYIPYALCRNGLRSKESNCRDIHEKMCKFADKIIAQRRETEPAEK